jgi:ATPase subunit of ABC transporter with duplicated ATPase domains
VSAPPAPHATLVAQHLTLARGDRLVLDDVSLTVAPGMCIGVVGANGVGKSTLLSVLAGRLEPDTGSVRRDPPRATVGLLDQEQRAVPGETVRAALARRTGVAAAEAELSATAAALGRGHQDAEDRYAAALERFVALSGGDLDARIDATLADLGVPGVAERVATTLSGGQAAKVALAAIELSRFDITLLDEPTNDLDFAGLDRLGGFVTSRHGGVVVVSHDRAFLEATVGPVLEIAEHDHRAHLFGGGWAAYLDQRETDRRHAEEAYRVYESQRAQLKARARTEREWATQGVRREKRRPRDNDKAQRDFRVNRTEQQASRARRTERALESLERVDKPWEGWRLEFTIEQAPRSGAVVARLEDAVIARESFRLGPVDLEIGWAERVALVGPNGAGKSTLVEALLGRLPLDQGRQHLGSSVVVGELGQDRSAVSSTASIVDRVVGRCRLTSTEARSLLAKFGLGVDQVARPASSLSPGERTRAELATFQGLGVNFLVLDEPTNHLDLPAIEQLESALASFGGTLLLVSHDRALLDAVQVTRTIDVVAFAGPAAGVRT